MGDAGQHDALEVREDALERLALLPAALRGSCAAIAPGRTCARTGRRSTFSR